MTAAAPQPFSEADAERLEQYLRSFDWPGRNAVVEEMIIAGGLPLWRAILDCVPPGPGRRGRLLELGSPPFHTTLLASRFRDYDIETTAGVIDDRRRLHQRIESTLYGEVHEFDCACFDLERERFPYDDASFDGVLFCEVIEHLTENPVFTLAEIHRVLRPGGWVLISTPNAARSGNLLRLFFGGNVFDQYHLGAPLKGSRHAREFTLRELRDLVAGCGYRLDIAKGRNLGQIQYTRRTRPLEPLFRLATLFAPGDHSDHLFVRAVKDGPFRWHFTRELFDEGHLRGYVDVRDAEMVVGVNDVPHTKGPWGRPREMAGVSCLPLGPSPSEVLLRAAAPCAGVAVVVVGGDTAARVRAELTAAGAGAPGAAAAELNVPAGDRTLLEVTLEAPLPAGATVSVSLSASTEVGVAAVRCRRPDDASA